MTDQFKMGDEITDLSLLEAATAAIALYLKDGEGAYFPMTVQAPCGHRYKVVVACVEADDSACTNRAYNPQTDGGLN